MQLALKVLQVHRERRVPKGFRGLPALVVSRGYRARKVQRVLKVDKEPLVQLDLAPQVLKVQQVYREPRGPQARKVFKEPQARKGRLEQLVRLGRLVLKAVQGLKEHRAVLVRRGL